MEMQVNSIEYSILQEKSREYLKEAMKDDSFGASGGIDEIRDAFTDGCLFTTELGQKIVEKMFSRVTTADAAKDLADDFRKNLFDAIKANKFSY